MIRMDSDVDFLVERNVGMRRCNRPGEAPIRHKERPEMKASHPPEILKQRHDQEGSASVGRLQFAAAGLAEIA